MKATAKIGQGAIYRNRNGDYYKCTRIIDNNTREMKRIGDGWTLEAHGIKMYQNGMIEWDHSTKGRWEE